MQQGDRASWEARLRDWAFRNGLGKAAIVHAYRLFCRLRFAGRWEVPIGFRGSRFVVGKDLSLYPAVRSGAFERDELDWLLPQVRSDATVWDVGANVGLYTVLMAKSAPGGQVIAFEPVDTTAFRLRTNIRLNSVGNVRVEPIALADKSGIGTMRVFGSAPGCNRLITGSEPNGEGVTMSVAVEIADSYAERTGYAPDVIKVDIEGAEPSFVRGARLVLSELRPLLIMEVNATTLRDDMARLAEWNTMLEFLFGLYGKAVWFDHQGSRVVTRLRPDDVIDLPRAATLAFGGEAA